MVFTELKWCLAVLRNRIVVFSRAKVVFCGAKAFLAAIEEKL